MDSMGGGHIVPHVAGSSLPLHMVDDLSRRNLVEEAAHGLAQEDERRDPGVSFLSNTSYLCDLRHDADEAAVPAAEPSVVSRWRMKDRVRDYKYNPIALPVLLAFMKVFFIVLAVCYWIKSAHRPNSS